jgi:hypothetical protein
VATTPTPLRALRGLTLGLALSVLNLLGSFLAIMALGGLGEWSGWQFIGLFGVLEVGTGLAFIIGPNIWRLPVAEANTSDRTKIHIAANTLFVPHWAAGAKAGAGLVLVVLAAWHEGVTLASLGILVFVAAVLALVVAVSLLFARWGVARPERDVVFMEIKRPNRDTYVLPGFSLGAITVQFLLNIGVFPTVKLLPPSILYGSAMRPSAMVLIVTVSLAAASWAAVVWAWRGRISWKAPKEQQEEQREEFAAMAE